VPGAPTPAELAARENADWCAVVCRTHGIAGARDELAWYAPARTPLYYPDAVTLRPAATPDDVLPFVDAGPGCSVKDSFAVLDLAPHGFEVVVEGSWVHLDPPDVARAPVPWWTVSSTEDLPGWLAAWAGPDADPRVLDVLRPALLDEPSVTLLAVPGGGAVLHRTEDAVGVSNVFGDPARVWPAVLHAASDGAPGLPLVGWVSGDGLTAARAAGLTPVGPMRVWSRP
jgi:hypothetical protein